MGGRDTPPRSERADSDETDKLLKVYEQLRSEIRTRIDIANNRATQSILVIITIVGVAITNTNFYILAFIPIVFGLLFIDTVRSYNELMIAARHLADIELRLSEDGSPFRYEIRRGGAFGEDRHITRCPGLTGPPNCARVGIYGLLYLGFCVFLFLAWDDPPILAGETSSEFIFVNDGVASSSLPELLGVEIEPLYVGAFFLLFTLVLVYVARDHRKQWKNLNESLEKDRRERDRPENLVGYWRWRHHWWTEERNR